MKERRQAAAIFTALGSVLLVAGIALVYVPAAFMVAGGVLLALGLLVIDVGDDA